MIMLMYVDVSDPSRKQTIRRIVPPPFCSSRLRCKEYQLSVRASVAPKGMTQPSSSLLSPSLHSPFLPSLPSFLLRPLPLFLSLPPLTLEVEPLESARGSGGAL